MLSLSKWPFNPDEVVTLKWIKSPYRNNKNKWILPIVFQDNCETIVNYEANWELISWLRIGQRFKNGRQKLTTKEGEVLFLTIDGSKGDIYLMESVGGLLSIEELDINREYIWVLREKNVTIIIPCIEIIRSFFTPNTILANALLKPNGLDFIVQPTFNSNVLRLEFDESIPSHIINDSFVMFIAWLVSNKKAKEAWNSILLNIIPDGALGNYIYNSLFEDSPELQSKYIKAGLPIEGLCTLEVRASIKDNLIIVYEIISIEGLSLSYDNVSYSHKPIVKRQRYDVIPKIKRNRLPQKNKRPVEKKLTDDNPRYKSRVNQINIAPTTMVFNKNIELIQMSDIIFKPMLKEVPNNRKLNKKERRLKEIAEHKANSAGQLKNDLKEQCHLVNSEALFSSSEVFYDGDPQIKPIEFQGLNVNQINIVNGLEHFCNMAELLPKIDARLKILDLKIMQLPGTKGFSIKEDGTPRNFALVTLTNGGRNTYILEIERLKKINLSTLLIWPKEAKLLNEHEVEAFLNELLIKLLRNYGKWDKEYLKTNPKTVIKTTKHLDNWTALDWAIVLIGTIYKDS